ncbi:MAG: 4-alpha-glucanotransferase [Geminicoccaceae bacterium]
MTGRTPLDRLAAAHHIELSYEDIWQKRHETSAETQRALLQAMGVSTDSDRAIKESLEAIADEQTSRLTPSIVVLRERDRMTLPITTQREGKSRFAWTFRDEDGVVHEGDGDLDGLEMTERVAVRGIVELRYALPLPVQPPPGYHRCTLVLDEMERAETEIIVTPKRCFLPECLVGARSLAGLTVPLYGLRSRRNAGIGDFSDLADLAATAAPLGADFVGINPTHALFPSQPHRISPYSPSSRLFSNVLLIALDKVPELDTSPAARAMLESTEAQARLERLRTSELVAYEEVSALKLGVLEALFQTFTALPENSLRKAAFRAYCETEGTALQNHARFDALSEWMLRNDSSVTDWRRWPAGYQTPDSPTVQAFADQHADRIAFYAYLQWVARDQLSQAQVSAKKAGGALGLYLDLAVGVAPDGAEAWAEQDVLVDGVRIGAPPDDFNPGGQNWGLLPLSPTALKADHYRPFIDLIRRNMRAAGALRIDHVLGLARSFWLPAEGDTPGAYIRYPLEDLLGLVALESVRNKCLVVGEDLGTVPETLRKNLDERGLLGCRLLYFERDENDACRPAAAYPQDCIASIGTHDLPTLVGFWQGDDMIWRERLGLYPDQERFIADREEREGLKIKLLKLLLAEELLPDDIDPSRPPAALTENLLLAFHRFIGMTPAKLKAIQLEDVVGAREQANLPGTVDDYPNWRRKIGVPIEELATETTLSQLLEAVSASPLPMQASADP